MGERRIHEFRKILHPCLATYLSKALRKIFPEIKWFQIKRPNERNHIVSAIKKYSEHLNQVFVLMTRPSFKPLL